MDLFDFNNFEETAKPLSERMRANNLNEFIGQKHLVAEGSLLRRAIASDRLGSCIFYGPPGCGKTTLANIIAMTTNGEFIKLNAVNSGVADVKKAVDTARDNLRLYNKRTYLMLDECHRFSKTQSDSLLPAIEKGTIIFIGSTTALCPSVGGSNVPANTHFFIVLFPCHIPIAVTVSFATEPALPNTAYRFRACKSDARKAIVRIVYFPRSRKSERYVFPYFRTSHTVKIPVFSSGKGALRS